MSRRDHEMNKPIPAARDLFDRASSRVDVATANRLRLARRDALATSPAGSHWLRSTTALAAALLLGVIWWAPTHAPSPAPTGASTDIPLDPVGVAGEDDAELYAWLGDAPVAPDQHAKSR